MKNKSYKRPHFCLLLKISPSKKRKTEERKEETAQTFRLFLSHPNAQQRKKAMGFHQQLQPSTLQQKKILAVLVISLLVASSAEQLGSAAPGRAARVLENSPVAASPEKQQPMTRRFPAAFGAYSTSKRRVPNASDPLHNR